MTLIHELSKLLDFNLLIHFSIFTCFFEVKNSLCLSKDMFGTLIQEELGILLLDFVNMGYITNNIKRLITSTMIFKLLWSVATRLQVQFHQFKHLSKRLS